MRTHAVSRWTVVAAGGSLDRRRRARDVPLVEAVKAGSAEQVRALLAQRADVNVAEADGTTALHWAVRGEAAPLVGLLIDAGADVGVANRYGRLTPLSLACVAGDAGIITQLLEAGADANAAAAGRPDGADDGRTNRERRRGRRAPGPRRGRARDGRHTRPDGADVGGRREQRGGGGHRWSGRRRRRCAHEAWLHRPAVRGARGDASRRRRRCWPPARRWTRPCRMASRRYCWRSRTRASSSRSFCCARARIRTGTPSGGRRCDQLAWSRQPPVGYDKPRAGAPGRRARARPRPRVDGAGSGPERPHREGTAGPAAAAQHGGGRARRRSFSRPGAATPS